MSYSLEYIANYFINKAEQDNRHDLTPMKLLKLVYISNGWSLGMNDQPLFSDEIEAWKYGPVIPALYHKVKKYGSKEITDKLPCQMEDKEFRDIDKKILDKVWDTYGQQDGLKLSAITHQNDTPWSKTWDNIGMRGLIIPNSLIRNYYRSLLGIEK